MNSDQQKVGPLLTREAVLKANDFAVERVGVPEWGGDVLVRTISGNELDEYQQEYLDARGKPTGERLPMMARLVSLAVVDESGQRVFPDPFVFTLGQKSARALKRVFEVAMRLSGMTEADQKELEKNSGSAQSGGSTSV